MLIERELNEDEKREITPLRHKQMTSDRVFKARMSIVEIESTEKKIPFCRPCAIRTFERQVKTLTDDLKEHGKLITSTSPETINIAKEFDFKPFIGGNKFKMIAVRKIEEPVIIDLVRMNKHVANYAEFVCNDFSKHHVSIRVELTQWEEWKETNMSKKEQKIIPQPELTNSVRTAN